MDRRVVQAALVVADGLVVVAGQVVGVAELEQRAGVAGVQLDRLLQGAHGPEAVALLQQHAGALEVVLGVVAGLVAHLGEDGLGLGQLALSRIGLRHRESIGPQPVARGLEQVPPHPGSPPRRRDREARDRPDGFGTVGIRPLEDVVEHAGQKRARRGVAPPDRLAVEERQEPPCGARPHQPDLVLPVLGGRLIRVTDVRLDAVAAEPERVVHERPPIEERQEVVERVDPERLDLDGPGDRPGLPVPRFVPGPRVERLVELVVLDLPVGVHRVDVGPERPEDVVGVALQALAAHALDHPHVVTLSRR